ncbi:unnamed protein product [Cuscuta europaea]|uniref:Xylanase inhibitor N-terminal domain-containing protein n=1 Tax=Cuscuta europaea TaxID=41803 RepID=A0A9P0ZGH1_CUSEU|nr:unnamed protein product [Cuscuta europaea]
MRLHRLCTLVWDKQKFSIVTAQSHHPQVQLFLVTAQNAGPRNYNASTYRVDYTSDSTSSTGILVKDVLHLETFDKKRHSSTAPVIFIGCGMVETGTILEKGAVNGLLGLGFNTPLDVPTVLASKGLVPNSFSLETRVAVRYSSNLQCFLNHGCMKNILNIYKQNPCAVTIFLSWLNAATVTTLEYSK